MRAWEQALRRLIARASPEERVRGELVGRWYGQTTLFLNPFVPLSLDQDLRQAAKPLYAAVAGSNPRDLTRGEAFGNALAEAERSRARRYPGFPVTYLVFHNPDMAWRPSYETLYCGPVQLWLEGDARSSLAFFGERWASGLDLARAPQDPEGLARYVEECHSRRTRLEMMGKRLTWRLQNPSLAHEVHAIVNDPDTRRAERQLSQFLSRLSAQELAGILL